MSKKAIADQPGCRSLVGHIFSLTQSLCLNFHCGQCLLSEARRQELWFTFNHFSADLTHHHMTDIPECIVPPTYETSFLQILKWLLLNLSPHGQVSARLLITRPYLSATASRNLFCLGWNHSLIREEWSANLMYPFLSYSCSIHILSPSSLILSIIIQNWAVFFLLGISFLLFMSVIAPGSVSSLSSCSMIFCANMEVSFLRVAIILHFVKYIN